MTTARITPTAANPAIMPLLSFPSFTKDIIKQELELIEVLELEIA